MPLVCLRYELNTTGKGRKCGLYPLFGGYFSRIIPLGVFVNSAETRHPSIITVAIPYMNSNYFPISTCKIQKNDYNNY